MGNPDFGERLPTPAVNMHCFGKDSLAQSMSLSVGRANTAGRDLREGKGVGLRG